MKTIRIYSKRLAEYLTTRDFKILKVVQDVSKPNFYIELNNYSSYNFNLFKKF